MDRFSKFNPKAALLFFAAVIVLDMLIFDPIFLAVSLVCAYVYKLKIEGRAGALYIVKFILPLLLAVTLFNFVFSHYGATVLFDVNDIPFTVQSMFYGFTQGLMLCSVLMWFSLYSKVITSERFLSVFGRFAPNLALIFSMVLSFIPRFKQNAQQIHDARMLMDNDKSKLKKSISDFSALVTMTLEQSIETADSMKSRGFGKKRTVYSKYRFNYKDLAVVIFVLFSFFVLTVFKISGYFDFVFDPDIIMSKAHAYLYILFAVLSLLPVIINFTEDIKWHYLKQKI